MKALGALAGVMLAGAAGAQTIPGLENYSLPAPQPTPAPPPLVAPSPIPTPAPTAVPIPPPTRLTLPPLRAPPRPASSPRSTAMPVPSPTPSASPAPQPSPPAPVAQPSTPASRPITPVQPTAPARLWWPWLLAAAGAVAVAVAGLRALARRRREGDEIAAEPIGDEVVGEAPAPASFLDRAPPAAPAGPAPRLLIGLRPIRAGLNLLSATAECEIAVANAGDAPAEGIRLEVSLLSAHAGQDADIAAALAGSGRRPAVPPFTLAPGEERRVRAVAILPREAVRPLAAAGPPVFVPMAAVSLRYRFRDHDGQATAAFAIGVERAGVAKLAPFRLDQPPRLHDNVAARRHMAVGG